MAAQTLQGVVIGAIWTCALVLISSVAAEPNEDNTSGVQQLFQKQRAGATLTDDEQKELERERAARLTKRADRKNRRGPEGRQTNLAPRSGTGLTPLDEFAPADTYKGKTGGLYGDSRNSPPADHLAAAKRAARAIEPLDASGQPDANGKIVLLSNGMSNTTVEFRMFVDVAHADRDLNPHLVVIDAAQGGQEASDWVDPSRRVQKGKPNPWDVQAARLQKAGVTPAQVQVVWMKQARRDPATLGEFPAHVEQLKRDQAEIIRDLKDLFPNLRLAYLSSRSYGGYATTSLNPEPFAYESAWANQWLIQEQITNDPNLNHDPAKGEVKAPVVLWGPYLWTDGAKGRKSDGFVYLSEDLSDDGTHPSESGQRKIVEHLMHFFKTDATARLWFVKEASIAPGVK